MDREWAESFRDGEAVSWVNHKARRVAGTVIGRSERNGIWILEVEVDGRVALVGAVQNVRRA